MRQLPVACFAFILFAAGGTAAAREVSFNVSSGGRTVPQSEVCFWSGEIGQGTFALLFSTDRVHCLPADSTVDLPPGTWNFSARNREMHLVSANPGAMRIAPSTSDAPPKRVQIEVVPAAVLDFTAVQPALNERERIVAYYPAPPHAANCGQPLPRGARSMLVPAGVPVIPLIVADGRAAAVGDVVTGGAGTTIRSTFSSHGGRSDVVVPIAVSGASERVESGLNAFEPELPAMELRSPTGARIAPAVSPNLADFGLAVFKDIQPGRYEFSLAGKTWERGRAIVVVSAKSRVATAETVYVSRAGAVIVRGEGEFAARVEQCATNTTQCEVISAARAIRGEAVLPSLPPRMLRLVVSAKGGETSRDFFPTPGETMRVGLDGERSRTH